MRTRLMAAGLLPLAALALTAGQAMADGGSTKAPTAKQRTAIMKAAGLKGPASCYSIALAGSMPTLAGVSFKSKAPSSCTKYAFDGSALWYGNPGGTAWFSLDEASSETPAHCAALKALVGVNAWQDLAGYASGLGCQNVD